MLQNEIVFLYFPGIFSAIRSNIWGILLVSIRHMPYWGKLSVCANIAMHIDKHMVCWGPFIRPSETNFNEILIETHTFSLRKMLFKMSSAKWRPFYLDLHVLNNNKTRQNTKRVHNSWDVLRPLQWRHNGHDSVSNHQPHDCLLNRLFRRRSRKTSKLRVTGLCAGNSPGTGEFPAQMPSNAEMFPFDDVIML